MGDPNVREHFIDGDGYEEVNPFWEGNLAPDNRKMLGEWDSAIAFSKTFFDSLGMLADSFDIEGEELNLVNYLNDHPKIKYALYGSFGVYCEVERTDKVVSMLASQGREN